MLHRWDGLLWLDSCCRGGLLDVRSWTLAYRNTNVDCDITFSLSLPDIVGTPDCIALTSASNRYFPSLSCSKTNTQFPFATPILSLNFHPSSLAILARASIERRPSG